MAIHIETSAFEWVGGSAPKQVVRFEGVQDARVACVGAALPVKSSGLGNGSQNVIPQLADPEN